MRIARVLHPECPAPIIALERDGSLYDVAELDRHFDTRFSPDRLAGAADFHTRVAGLSCAGLLDLDEALRAGRRARDARVIPGSYLWLAPCATERALFVHVRARSEHAEPSYAFGNARGLLGHGSVVAFPAREEEPDVEIGLAAILGEGVHRASAAEAEAAVLGYAVMAEWVARGEERRSGGAARARDFGVQLGPLLVHKAVVGDILALGARVRAADRRAAHASCGALADARWHIAEAIAFVSDHIELSAGDVVALGGLGSATAALGRPLTWGEPIEIALDRVGTLSGRAVRGPQPVPWRRAPA